MPKNENGSSSLFGGLSAVSKTSLPEQVYESLREALMSGRFAPGQRVPLRALAEAMGTSTMPVREAVNRLVAIGSLELLPNRRVCVPKLSLEYYLDLSKAKILVESAAAEHAALILSESIIDDLEILHREMCMVQAFEHNKENVQRYLALNKEFHFTIYRQIGSLTLINLIESLWLQVGPYFNLLHGKTTKWRGNVKHEEIIRALRERDPRHARRAMSADLEGASNYLVAEGLIG